MTTKFIIEGILAIIMFVLGGGAYFNLKRKIYKDIQLKTLNDTVKNAKEANKIANDHRNDPINATLDRLSKDASDE